MELSIFHRKFFLPSLKFKKVYNQGESEPLKFLLSKNARVYPDMCVVPSWCYTFLNPRVI